MVACDCLFRLKPLTPPGRAKAARTGKLNLYLCALIHHYTMISVDSVSVEFNGAALFSNVTFNINETDRIALMGKNGAGKSTLLKIIAGANKPTKGKVSAPRDAIIAYLPQHLLTKDDATVFEEASKAFSKILGMKQQMEELNRQLETRTDYESDEY